MTACQNLSQRPGRRWSRIIFRPAPELILRDMRCPFGLTVPFDCFLDEGPHRVEQQLRGGVRADEVKPNR